MTFEFSDYIVYVDESGDHHLVRNDEEYPVFVLAFCIFNKPQYNEKTIPLLNNLKFDFWGHDLVILHSHKIRKQKEEFAILGNLPTMERFVGKLNTIISNTDFSIIATVIDKRLLRSQFANSISPYNLGLLFCLEQATFFLEECEQQSKMTYIVVEGRGKKEDAELELEFIRIKSRLNNLAKFQIVFADKKINNAGLQIADLIAHPIGRHTINPEQLNRSFNILEKKFYKYPDYEEKGLMVFPSLPLESEKPQFTPRFDADQESPIHFPSLYSP
jgi:nitrogen regulatory protein PII